MKTIAANKRGRDTEPIRYRGRNPLPTSETLLAVTKTKERETTMGLINWFKKATFDGMIKRTICKHQSPKGTIVKMTLSVEEMEKKWKEHNMFRFNFAAGSLASYQSLAILLTEEQVEEMVASLTTVLNESKITKDSIV